MNNLQNGIKILYQNSHILIVQTGAGVFNKFAQDDLYGQFNLGLHVGDKPECVLKNRADLLSSLRQLTHQKTQSIFWLNQVHGNRVLDTKSDFFTSNQDADALVSYQKYEALAIMTADCVPIAIFDDKDGIACIHAGWQGLTNGIIKKTAIKLHGQKKAVIGACISKQNYEIDLVLADRIVKKVIENQLVDLNYDALYSAIIQKQNTEKCYIDIVKLTHLQLAFLSIECLSDKIACSYDKTDLYSYRAQTHAKKIATGRMATVIVRY